MLVDKYKELGYVISDKKIISDDLLDCATEGVSDLLQRKFDTGKPPYSYNWTSETPLQGLHEMNGAHVASSKIRKLLDYKPMIDFMAEATGASAIKLGSIQLFYKPPGGDFAHRKNFISYHQDGSYQTKQFIKSEVFSCWIPLTDMSEKNGTMQYIARSQLLGPGLNNINFAKFDLNEEPFKSGNCYGEFVNIPRGYLSVHHGDLFHGSGANTTDSPRIALVLHCLKDSYTVNKDTVFWKLDDPFYCPDLL